MADLDPRAREYGERCRSWVAPFAWMDGYRAAVEDATRVADNEASLRQADANVCDSNRHTEAATALRAGAIALKWLAVDIRKLAPPSKAN